MTSLVEEAAATGVPVLGDDPGSMPERAREAS
jgi:hypothetical protein